MRRSSVRDWIVLFGVALFWNFGLGPLFLWVRGRALFGVPPERMALAYGIFSAMVALALVLALLGVLRERIRDHGYRLPDADGWRAALALLGALFPVFLLGRLIDPSFDAWFVAVNGLGNSGAVWAFVPVVAAFVVAEEIFVRFLQDRLQLLIPRLAALLAVAVFFALLHATPVTPHTGALVASDFFAAFVLAVLYAKTRSIAATIVFHFCLNAVSLIGIVLHASGERAGELFYWILFAALFGATLRSALRTLRAGVLGERPRTDPGAGLAAQEWLLLIVFAVGLPLLALV